MFEKLKQLKELKDLQSALGQEREEIEKNGVKVIMNGKMEIEQISLNPELDKEKQEKVLKECINDAVKKIQFRLAQKMAQIPGFGNF